MCGLPSRVSGGGGRFPARRCNVLSMLNVIPCTCLLALLYWAVMRRLCLVTSSFRCSRPLGTPVVMAYQWSMFPKYVGMLVVDRLFFTFPVAGSTYDWTASAIHATTLSTISW